MPSFSDDERRTGRREEDGRDGYLGAEDNYVEKRSEEEGQQVWSNSYCAICSGGSRFGIKTAKLLILTAEWNFYYCYRCNGWYQSHCRSKGLVYRVSNKKMESALTWFWKSENELYEENKKTMSWFHSLLGKDSSSGT